MERCTAARVAVIGISAVAAILWFGNAPVMSSGMRTLRNMAFGVLLVAAPVVTWLVATGQPHQAGWEFRGWLYKRSAHEWRFCEASNGHCWEFRK